MLDSVRWKPLCPGQQLPGRLRLIDQTKLPETLTYVELDDAHAVYDAIKRLVVRGAPAIGCAAALGLAAVSQHSSAETPEAFLQDVRHTADYLASSRPTAINLRWALDRCTTALAKKIKTDPQDIDSLKHAVLNEALNILQEDIRLCRNIGLHGIPLFAHQTHIGVLTHCNAGALATADYGTALAPIYMAQEKGLAPHVYADETRPLLQGSRLTAWELQRSGVEVTVICDSMAGLLMRDKKISLILVGADRIAANGDVANKIGTYSLAVLAKYHGVPFYVAAPYSTIDPTLPDGSQIPIEQREPGEIIHGFGRQTAPLNCHVYNPAFDITPHTLITGIVTNRALLAPPFDRAIRRLLARCPVNPPDHAG
ncbi:MAG: S-methyl-5-thioribose-1-phosphate isomerase [Candidatus Pacebacteria bacterium]|nr:S-methyl-5-thioribose-1-phosphate isomerase [Candidatus Paceibacterota bacterium]